MDGSLIKRINKAGTTLMWVTPWRSMSWNISPGRVLPCKTTVAPWNMKPWMPGQASGRLWAMGSTSNSTESGPTCTTSAATLEL